jgi:hypothetical protein
MDHRICWRFDRRLLTKWFMTDSADADEMRQPAILARW